MKAIMNICEYYNDIFKLPGDGITMTTAKEHAIPTPGLDPCRGIQVEIIRFPMH
jgi:hypothetical protein